MSKLNNSNNCKYNFVQVFPRDEDDDPETVSLSSSILNTEVLRIVALPGSWNTDRVCVRFEAYGCPATIGMYLTVCCVIIC